MAVTSILRDGPHTSRDIAVKLGLKSLSERDQLKKRIVALCRANTITRADERRFPAYKLISNGVRNGDQIRSD